MKFYWSETCKCNGGTWLRRSALYDLKAVELSGTKREYLKEKLMRLKQTVRRKIFET
jgi:hypothetical protein